MTEPSLGKMYLMCTLSDSLAQVQPEIIRGEVYDLHWNHPPEGD